MEKIDAMKELNAACYEMVSHCETKSSILSAIDLGIITAVTAVYGSNAFFISSSCKWYWWVFIIYFMLSCFGSFLSLTVCLASLLSKIQKAKSTNIFYYKDVSNMSAKDYLECINDKKIEIDMANENVQLSKVVHHKYKLFNIALFILLTPISLFIYPIFFFIKSKIKN